MASIKPFSKPQAPKNSKQQVNVHSDNRQKAIVKETNSEKASLKMSEAVPAPQYLTTVPLQTPHSMQLL